MECDWCWNCALYKLSTFHTILSQMLNKFQLCFLAYSPTIPTVNPNVNPIIDTLQHTCMIRYYLHRHNQVLTHFCIVTFSDIRKINGVVQRIIWYDLWITCKLCSFQCCNSTTNVAFDNWKDFTRIMPQAINSYS